MKLRIQGLKLRDYGHFVLRLVFLLLLLLLLAERMDEDMPWVASGWSVLLHLLLILLGARQQRQRQPCELRAHRVSGGINRDGTRSWSLGEKPRDPWKLAQTSFPQRLRRSYSHAFAPSGE